MTLYYKLKEQILNIGNNIIIKPTKQYIVFKKNTNFAYVNPTKSGLRIDINTSNFKISDPNGISKIKSRWAQVYLKKEDEIPYIVHLVKQSYERN